MQPEQLIQVESTLAASAEELIAGRGGEPGRDGETGDAWQEALTRLTRAATASVPGAAYAGMTSRGADGMLVSQAASHPQIAELDRAQARLGQGPCVDALTIADQHLIRVDDFAAESRWPSFAAAAVAAGIGSLLSYALTPRGSAPGAMNFYATAPHAFDDPAARAIAGVFAMEAGIAVYGADRVAQLHRGLESRDVIGQAKGILMERFSLDDQQAFDLLVRSSQDTNIKLVEVARWLAGDVAARAHHTPDSRDRR